MVITPEQKWKETIQLYKKKCQKIMSVSNDVRYAGIINKYGRTLTGVIKPGIKMFLNSEQAKNEFFLITALITLRNSYKKALGDLEYVLLKHRHVNILVFQKQNVVYYITVESKVKNFENIISKIKKIL